MKAARPSQTAHFVALGRAMADAGVSHVSDFRDPTARIFLTEKGKRNLSKVESAARSGQRSVSFEMARVMADMIALRTAAIDAAVGSAINGGATQLVILGAGYDGRAWRMTELAGVHVFEVDHPVTQSEKRAHLSELPRAIAEISFVSIDFEHESLNTVLERAGHDPSSPTCWIWEGVIMYLTRDAMRTTLGDIARRSAPGSTLIVNYHMAHRHFFARLMFRLIGEPQISAWTPEEIGAELESRGFLVGEDSGMSSWNNQFAQGQAKVERGTYMRIAIAQS